MKTTYKIMIAVMVSMLITAGVNEAVAQNKQLQQETAATTQTKTTSANAIDKEGRRVNARTESQRGTKQYQKTTSSVSTKSTARAVATDKNGKVRFSREDD